MADGGGDLTVVELVEFEFIVWVDSETIGSAAKIENDTHQNAITITKAYKLFLSRGDINRLLRLLLYKLL